MTSELLHYKSLDNTCMVHSAGVRGLSLMIMGFQVTKNKVYIFWDIRTQTSGYQNVDVLKGVEKEIPSHCPQTGPREFLQ